MSNSQLKWDRSMERLPLHKVLTAKDKMSFWDHDVTRHVKELKAFINHMFNWHVLSSVWQYILSHSKCY